MGRLSLGGVVFLVFGYGVASATLGMAVAAAALHALYPGVAGWRGPAVGAGMSLVIMGACWWTMPANRLPVGVLILRVGMVAALVVGVFVARRVLFGRSPVLAVEVFALVIAAVMFVVGLGIARGTRWGRKWAR